MFKRKSTLMKVMSTIVMSILLLTFLFVPYNVSFGADNSKIKLYIMDQWTKQDGAYLDTNTLIDNLKKARGEKTLKGIDRYTVDLGQEPINNKKQQYDAFAVPLVYIDQETENKIKDFIKSGKLVYIYGDSVNIKTAENIFGEEIRPTDQSTEQKVKKPNAMKVCNNYQVIGLQMNDKKYIYFGSIQLVDSSLDITKFTDSIIDNLNSQHLKDIKAFSFLKKNVVEASGTRIDSDLNNSCSTWVGGTKICQLNGDYYLWREYDEIDPDYDYFSIQSNMELYAYNGASNSDLYIWHDLPYSSDEIEDWSPDSSSSGSSWTVGLPWSISWSFSTGDSVNVTVDGSQTYDNVEWYVTFPWWQLHLPSPIRFKPGTAWLSTGTCAAIDIQTSGLVLYNGDTYSVEQTMDYRYDY